MMFARLLLAWILAAGLAAPHARAATEIEQRAAVLVYRQALHADGDGIALGARLLTERAASGEPEDLSRLRERLLRLAGGRTNAPPPPPSVPGGAGDLAASLIARHAGALREPAAPRLWGAWSQVEGGAGLVDLVPYLRAEARASAGAIWVAALGAAEDDERLASALDPLLRELTGAGTEVGASRWRQQPPPMPSSDLETGPGAAWLETTRSALASALASPDRVDPHITARLRARWFLVSRDPAADPAALALSGLWIGLRDNVPALAAGDPVPFLSALLAGARHLSAVETRLADDVRAELAAGLALLGEGAASGGPDWDRVDGRLQAIRDDVVAELERAAGDDAAEAPRLGPLLLAEARLSLLADDWEAYLMQPFREPIQQALADCFPLAIETAASCRMRFEDWAMEGAGVPEASGDVGGPFEPENLLRETDLNPWQRVNYLRGFWRQLLVRECSGRDRIRNGLEWALASRAYIEVVRRAGIAGNGDVALGLDRLADVGTALAGDLADFGACRAQGRGPLLETLSAYATAVNRMTSALPAAGEAFREDVLKPGSDISLDEGGGQSSSYAPEGLTIGPCDATPSCGVAQALPGAAELYRRFPAPFRVADQSGLGTLSLCYGDVSWIERRAEPVRASSGVMANYHGRLSFRVRGRYRAGGEVRDVYVLRMSSEDAYPYLFGPNRPEVLADPCPQEFQGRQTVGELPEARGWLVPRRLTFLSGERTSPTRLFNENWTRGRDWLGRLVAGRAVEVEREAGGEDLTQRVESHLANLRGMRRAYLYELLLAPMPAGDGNGAPARLTDTALEFSATRRALDAGARLLLPRGAMLTPELRGSLYGSGAMLGPADVSAWREADRDPAALAEEARERLEAAGSAWRSSADRAEIAPFVARTLIALLGTRSALEAGRFSAAADAAGAASPPRTGPGPDPFP